MSAITGAATRRPRRLGEATSLLALPAVLVFAVALAIPLGLLLLASVRVDGSFTVANYTRFFGDSHRLLVLGNTVTYGVIVTLTATVVAYPYAFAMARAPAALQTVLLLGIFLPMTSSVIVKTFGWQVLLKGSGLVNSLLMALGLTDAPVRLLFTETGLYIGTVSLLLPYMVLPIYAVMRLVPRSLEEAAATLGGSRLFVLLRVTLPLSMPGVLTGMAFVFSMTTAAYVIPSLLAGARFQVLSKVAANAYLVMDDARLGATVSAVMLVLAGGGAALLTRFATLASRAR